MCKTVSQKCAVHEIWITARGKKRIQRILIKERPKVFILIGKVYFPEGKNPQKLKLRVMEESGFG